MPPMPFVSFHHPSLGEKRESPRVELPLPRVHRILLRPHCQIRRPRLRRVDKPLAAHVSSFDSREYFCPAFGLRGRPPLFVRRLFGCSSANPLCIAFPLWFPCPPTSHRPTASEGLVVEVQQCRLTALVALPWPIWARHGTMPEPSRERGPTVRGSQIRCDQLVQSNALNVFMCQTSGYPTEGPLPVRLMEDVPAIRPSNAFDVRTSLL